MKARKVLDDAVRVLKASTAIDHWQRGRERLEAEDLLWHVVGREPDPSDDISVEQRRVFDRLVERRVTGEPIPFIKGYTEFRGLDLLVRPGVFVPRDASEFLAEQALRRLRGRADPVHVDLATGAGTIALAVANEIPRASVIGTDVSAEAVTLARANARRLGLRARFVTGDLFGGLPRKLAGTVDVVTLHPPYVPMRELKDLPEEIRAMGAGAHPDRPEPRRARTHHPNGARGAGVALAQRVAVARGESGPGAARQRRCSGARGSATSGARRVARCR